MTKRKRQTVLSQRIAAVAPIDPVKRTPVVVKRKPGREFTCAPWTVGKEPREFGHAELKHLLAPLNLRQRTYDAVWLVMIGRRSYRAAAQKLGETQTYVRGAVIATFDRLGGALVMYAQPALHTLLVPNVPPELHLEATGLVQDFVRRYQMGLLLNAPSAQPIVEKAAEPFEGFVSP